MESTDAFRVTVKDSNGCPLFQVVADASVLTTLGVDLTATNEGWTATSSEFARALNEYNSEV